MLQTVIDFRLDWALLATATIAAMLVVRGWLGRTRKCGDAPLLPRLILPALLIASALGAELAGSHERGRLRRVLEGIAPTYAAELTRMGYEQLATDTAADEPKYLELIEAQKRWLRVNPLVSNIYTLHRSADGSICVLLDSETDFDGDGRYAGERERRTRIGQPYRASDPLLRAFTGQPVFDGTPVASRGGNTVSAYSPLFDRAGRVIGVLGVDYGADGWNKAILLGRGIVLSSAAIVATALLATMAVIMLARKELGMQNEIARSLRQSESRLRAMALYDRLTNLPNRALLNDRVSQAILRARRRSSYRFALMFIDLDGFKKVNDQYGHESGDLLLKLAAERFRIVLRETDTICREAPSLETEQYGALAARLGGDEFVILLDDIACDADLPLMARRILSALSAPCDVNGHRISLSASIGIARSDPRYHTVEQMLRDADVAMYHAKLSHHGGFAVFDTGMQQQQLEHVVATNELRAAIEQGHLLLEFRPIVSLEDRSVRGFEALVRWNHPTRGRILPDQFIPLAEESGLIVPLGHWALREAARTIVRWRAALPHASGLAISVNISRRQLGSAALAEEIRTILKEAGARPDELKLEITESLIAHDPEAARTSLEALKQMGLGLVVDDFGLGSSSLGLLHRFPVEGLKIDRSFMAQVSQQREYAAVVQTIVDLARNLELTLVAEGVETPEQAAMLQAMGCTLAQGYLFSRPLNPRAALEFASGLRAQSAA